MELAFSFLFPFCPHYLLLTFLLLALCFPAAWLHSAAARPPPAVGGGEGLPDAQASQDPAGEEAGGRCPGETAARVHRLGFFLTLSISVGHAAALEYSPAARLFTQGNSHSQGIEHRRSSSV